MKVFFYTPELYTEYCNTLKEWAYNLDWKPYQDYILDGQKTLDEVATEMAQDAIDNFELYDDDGLPVDDYTADDLNETRDDLKIWILRRIDTDIRNDDNVAMLVMIEAWNELEGLVWGACETFDRNGLSDWLENGLYNGSETIENLAEDWDEICTEAKNL